MRSPSEFRLDPEGTTVRFTVRAVEARGDNQAVITARITIPHSGTNAFGGRARDTHTADVNITVNTQGLELSEVREVVRMSKATLIEEFGLN
jgi:hypothetical protein